MPKPIAGASAVLLLILLTGCERGASEADDALINVAGPETYQDRLLAMAEGERNATFIRAIRDADAELTCQGVESSAYVGAYQGLPMWTARCDDGTDWALLVGPEGATQVLTCQQAAAAGMPSCATRPTA